MMASAALRCPPPVSENRIRICGLSGVISFAYYPGDKGFYPAIGFASGQQDAMPTGQAFQPNICSQPGNTPFVAPAWMGLAKVNDITQLQFLKHAGIISSESFHRFQNQSNHPSYYWL
jgi:hypothetical protein